MERGTCDQNLILKLVESHTLCSAAGKTQFALQLSLYVQAPTSSGGLCGAACYLTTSSTLPTTRLVQIAEHNGLLSIGCGLANVHTIAAPTVAVLQRVLAETLPAFIEQQAFAGKKHVKLLVIDALGELFHSTTRTTTSTLVERSKDISSISASLHGIATKCGMAILVLNEVIDVFNRPSGSSDQDQGDMFYDQQSRWFNTAEFFGQGTKEATLGLTWANSVNTRIMLSRTGRRKYLIPDDYPKRLHLVDPAAAPVQTDKEADQAEPTLIRRLSILFSSVTSPISLDYIVTECGISVIQEDVPQTTRIKDTGLVDQVANIPNNPVHNAMSNSETKSTILQDGDEFDQLWEQEEYQNIDWDALEVTLSQNT